MQNRTRIMSLLVLFRFRSSYRSEPRRLTNFGIGALVVRQRNALPAVAGAAIVAMKVMKATTIR